ncbi:transporter, MscS family [Synechococcus sp. PCC 7335]|uniref:mechanosensitive ion channel family protein n=1 Tax=Synechococcus sp. (strain ATCC 29403 / PCC 7335) TaxID=91464 RepID=UPI00017ED8D1|nr:mechanosensitive ion channel family protein [Synechococcus sp. PCC 7335]EDX86302.1 transporter, MscS family [Synechococcus sp. PCC 7335]
MENSISLSAATEKLSSMIQGAIALLPNIVIGIVIFILFWILGRFVRSFIRRQTKHRDTRNVGLVFGRLIQGGLVILGFLIAATIIFPSFNPADALAALGIGGVAIGFAFKDILQNFLAGILILLTEPFKLNDQIIFNGYEGTVEHIQTRATTIRTYDGRRVVIPNAELFTNAVIVNTAYDRRRLEYDIGIGYGDDIAQAKKIILRTLSSRNEVIKDPAPEALVVALADSTINIRARWWIEPPRQADMVASRDWVLENVCNELVAAGIDLPFPTQQVLFHDQTEETDGNRAKQREGWPVQPEGDSPRALNLSRSVLTMVKRQREQTENGQ